MRNVTVAATQMACTWNKEKTILQAAALVEEAAEKGANIVLLQELFETPYFCQQDLLWFLLYHGSYRPDPAECGPGKSDGSGTEL